MDRLLYKHRSQKPFSTLRFTNNNVGLLAPLEIFAILNQYIVLYCKYQSLAAVFKWPTGIERTSRPVVVISSAVGVDLMALFPDRFGPRLNCTAGRKSYSSSFPITVDKSMICQRCIHTAIPTTVIRHKNPRIFLRCASFYNSAWNLAALYNTSVVSVLARQRHYLILYDW